MIITKTYHPVVHAATLKSVTQDDASQDPYTTAAAAASSAVSSTVPTPVATDDSDKEQAYEEAFARMQVQMQVASSAASTSTSASSTSASSAVGSTSSSTDSIAASSTSGMTSTQQAFMDYMQETPAQKIQDSVLQEMGLTKAQFDSLPPEKKDAVQKEIAQRMKDELEKGGTQDAKSAIETAAA